MAFLEKNLPSFSLSNVFVLIDSRKGNWKWSYVFFIDYCFIVVLLRDGLYIVIQSKKDYFDSYWCFIVNLLNLLLDYSETYTQMLYIHEILKGKRLTKPSPIIASDFYILRLRCAVASWIRIYTCVQTNYYKENKL